MPISSTQLHIVNIENKKKIVYTQDTNTTINKNPSRENVSNVEQGQVILTKARPATVISSAPSPALSEMKPLNQVERY